MDRQDTIEDVLTKISKRFGSEILGEERKLLAYVSDLAPHLISQRKLLEYFVECKGPSRIVSVQNTTSSEQDACVNKVINEMHTKLFIDEMQARLICEAFHHVVLNSKEANVFGKLPRESDQDNSKGSDIRIEDAKLTAQEQFSISQKYYSAGDYRRALRWCLEAARGGYVPAHCRLGTMLLKGQGCKRDLTKAVIFYRNAAEQGNTDAMCCLALCYKNGYGVEKDISKAITIFEKAAALGHSGALIEIRHIRLSEIDADKINDLVQECGYDSHYLLCSGTKHFNKQVLKAKNKYAHYPDNEIPLLMLDFTTIGELFPGYGSASHGFVLTNKSLYYNVEETSGHALIKDIVSVSCTANGTSYYVELHIDSKNSDGKEQICRFFSGTEESAKKLQEFWKTLLFL